MVVAFGPREGRVPPRTWRRGWSSAGGGLGDSLRGATSSCRPRDRTASVSGPRWIPPAARQAHPSSPRPRVSAMRIPRLSPLAHHLRPRRLPGRRNARQTTVQPAPRLRLRGPCVRFRGGRPGDLPRARHRQPFGRLARCGDRQRGGRAPGRIAHLRSGRIRRRGRDRGPHRQAGPVRGQHPLPLRPLARQPDLPARRACDRPRGHPRDAHQRRFDGPFVPELSRGTARADRRTRRGGSRGSRTRRSAPGPKAGWPT